jgi:arsenate reductase
VYTALCIPAIPSNCQVQLCYTRRPQLLPDIETVPLADQSVDVVVSNCVPNTGAMMATVIFACVHNAGRSQMAAAFFNQLADPSLARAVSAGTRPGTHVHPEVVAVMREVGIDLAPAQPRLLTPELASTASHLITLGCGDECPVVPGATRDDWPLADPRGQSLDRVRAIRDEIHGRVASLIAAHGWQPRPSTFARRW